MFNPVTESAIVAWLVRKLGGTVFIPYDEVHAGDESDPMFSDKGVFLVANNEVPKCTRCGMNMQSTVCSCGAHMDIDG